MKLWGNERVSLLCGLATLFAQKAFFLASGYRPSAEITADCSKLADLLRCISSNYNNCDTVRNLLPGISFPDEISTYSSIFDYTKGTNALAFVFSAFLANATASSRESMCNTVSECKV